MFDLRNRRSTDNEFASHNPPSGPGLFALEPVIVDFCDLIFEVKGETDAYSIICPLQVIKLRFFTAFKLFLLYFIFENTVLARKEELLTINKNIPPG